VAYVAPTPLTCPWCGAAANPSPAPQACSACRKRFTLTAGPALDPSLAVPPPVAPVFYTQWSAVVTYKFARLEPMGVTSGTLDPVVAMAPMDQAGMAYSDVASIAVWRRIAWAEPIIAVLVPAPIALFMLFLAVSVAMNHAFGGAAVMSIIGLAFGALAAFMIRRGVVLGRRNLRVTSRWNQSMTIPFERVPAFCDQLFARCGLPPPPLP
jgi:hypothetical protein